MMRTCVKCGELSEAKPTKFRFVCRRCRNGRRVYCPGCKQCTARSNGSSCPRCARDDARAKAARLRSTERKLAAQLAEQQRKIEARRPARPTTTVPLRVWMAQQEDRIRASGIGSFQSSWAPLARSGYGTEG